MKSIKTKLLGAMSKLMVVALAVSVVNIQPTKAANAATNGVSLVVTGDASKVGNVVTIDVKADNIAGVYGASVDFKYDTNVFEVTSITQGAAISTLSKIDVAAKTSEKSVVASLKGNAAAVTANGTIATITATVKAAQTKDTTIKVSNNYQNAVNNDVVVKLADTNSAAINYTGVGSTAVIKGEVITPVDPTILQPGSYEEDNANLKYTGNWLNDVHSLYSAGKGKYSIKRGDSVEFKINATGFQLIAPCNDSRGRADIYIDGKLVSTSSQYLPTMNSQYVYFEASGLTPGVHTVKVATNGNKEALSKQALIVFDKIVVSNDIVVNQGLTAGSYEENNKAFSYSGSWNLDPNAGYSAGLGKYTNVAGSSVSFDIVGTGFELHAPLAASRGNVNIYIDGVKVGTASQYSATNTYGAYYTKTGLTNGKHKVTVEWNGVKAPGATNTLVTFDKVVVK